MQIIEASLADLRREAASSRASEEAGDMLRGKDQMDERGIKSKVDEGDLSRLGRPVSSFFRSLCGLGRWGEAKDPSVSRDRCQAVERRWHHDLYTCTCTLITMDCTCLTYSYVAAGSLLHKLKTKHRDIEKLNPCIILSACVIYIYIYIRISYMSCDPTWLGRFS